MPINGFLYPGASGPPSAYEVANSLRFNDGSSEQLSIVTSAGSDYKATFSAWVKKTTVGVESFLLYGYYNSNNKHVLNFYQDQIYINLIVGASTAATVVTNRVFRDPSAWYHIVVAWDTTQGTASDRIKVYVNGVQETSFGTANYPNQNTNIQFNRNTNGNYVGGQAGSNTFDGYMSEVVYIDGSALDPTSFGEFDSDSPNIWKPIDVSGLTFGTNGFYLEFKQSGTSQNSSGLGADTSGNDNHLAVHNLTATDQTTDTCTNNFATLNPLAVPGASNTFSEGNLEITNSADANRASFSTIGVSSGKWYYECKVLSGEMKQFIGISKPQESTIRPGDTAGSYGYSAENGKKYNNDSNASYGSSASSGDIIMVAFDADNGTIWVGKNGTWFNSATQSEIENGTTTNSMYSSITIDDFFMMAVSVEDSNVQMNFGSPMYSISSGNSDGNGYGNFEYSVPSGYYSINTKNLAEFG